LGDIEFRIRLVGRDATGYDSEKVTLTVVKAPAAEDDTPVVITKPNSPPYLTEPLAFPFKLAIKQEDTESIIFTSPIINDDEGDTVSIAGQGFQDLPCKCLSVKYAEGDKKFTLTLDRAKLTAEDTGEYEISVSLKDDQSAISTQIPFVLNIQYGAAEEADASASETAGSQAENNADSGDT
jgi:hypothetical protein